MNLKMNGTPVLEKNLKATKDVVVNEGGSRSSKTYSIAQTFIIEMLKVHGKIFSIVRKTLPALRSTAMKDFFDLLKEYNLYDEALHNKSDNTYILHDNLVEFFSVDEAQKIRGRKRDWLWINEANELDVEDWRQLVMRTSERIFLDYNPSEPEDHWIYTEVLTRDDVELIKSTYQDNPFLSERQIQEIERFRKLDPSYWQVYGLGERCELQIGTVFIKTYYGEYDILPEDIKSVIYCDPNLSIKTKGDTTAIVHLGYSAHKDTYYILDAVCRSFADSNELLNTIMKLKTGRTMAIGFDGHVAQESSWTNLVKNWAQIHDSPFYKIEYKRYRVDDLAKNIQLAWVDKKILFPPGFRASMESKLFLAQLFAFRGKKEGNPDDAPDSLICAFEFIHERRLDSKVQSIKQPVIQPVIEF